MEVIILNKQNGLFIQAKHVDMKIVKKNLCFQEMKKVGKKLFIKDYTLYKVLTSDIVIVQIPRYCPYMQMIKSKNIKILNKIPKTKEIKYDSQLKLYEYQTKCTDKIYDLLTNNYVGGNSCIFVLDTGLGKTYISVDIIAKIKKKTLVILPNKVGLQDWLNALNVALPQEKIGQYHSMCKTDGNIVITTVQSCIREEINNMKRIDYFAQFGFVIIDEIHSMCSDERMKLMWDLNLEYKMGLTATPDENGELDKMYQQHFGPLLYAETFIGINPVKWNIEVHKYEYYGPPKYTEAIKNVLDCNDFKRMCNLITQDPTRTQMAYNIVEELNKQGYNTFIFAEHRDHLINLHAKFDNDSMFLLMGGSKDRQKIEQEAKTIFTTYAYSKQSLSIKKMNAIVFLTPRRNKLRQILGRILRVGGDEQIVRKVIDIVDMNTTLKSQWYDRKKVYDLKEANISIFKTSS